MVLPIVALRAAALKKHRNANAKASRLKAQGVNIAGSELDLRRSWDVVKNYNAKQLSAYMVQLDRFNARTYRVRALRDGVPLALGRWEAYERAERKYNARVESALDKVGHLMPPDTGFTIRQRQDMRKTVMGGANTENSVLHETHRDRRNIKDADALDKLQAQLERRTSPEYHETQIRGARAAANDMMDRIGANELRMEVEQLTDEQFDVLWSRTRFRDILIAIYEEIKNNKGNANYSEELADAQQLVRWAAALTL